MYEATNIDKQVSAIGLVSNLLSDHIVFGLGSTSSNLGNFVQLKSTSLDTAYSLLSSNNHFKVTSSPSLPAQPDSRGIFSVGQEAPVLGALLPPKVQDRQYSPWNTEAPA